MMAANPELLKTAGYFSGLDAEGLAEVSRLVFEKRLPAGETLMWEGENDKSLYFVISGLLKLFATSAEGRDFIVRLVYGGDSLNDDTVFADGPNLLNAVTMSPVVLYGLRPADLERVLRDHPEVRAGVTGVLARRQRYLVRLATGLVFQNVTARLARLLLEREKLAPGGAGEPKMTQQEMAAMIGTVRELVSRSLRELEAMGAVRLQHNRIVITDREKLLELGE
ncbi:MAG: Crp/Fnr family transcriptional regulator [Chloroflexota bacterium]